MIVLQLLFGNYKQKIKTSPPYCSSRKFLHLLKYMTSPVKMYLKLSAISTKIFMKKNTFRRVSPLQIAAPATPVYLN